MPRRSLPAILALGLGVAACASPVPSSRSPWRWPGGRRDKARAYLLSQTEAGRIEAVLAPRLCRETMADAAYSYRAEATVVDTRRRRTFNGCAGLGAGLAPS